MAILDYLSTRKPQLLLSITLSIVSVVSFALKSDLEKAANISADSVEYNHQTGVSTYRGHIHAVQGTTELFADRIIIHRTEKNKIDKIIAFGKTAHYETLPDGQKEKIHAFANTIEYYPLKKEILLIGQAEVDFEKNKLAAAQINYNIEKQVASTTPTPQSKTTIVLHPVKKEKRS